MASQLWEAVFGVALVEEASKSLGQLLAVFRMGDEVAPARRNQFAATERFYGQARENVDKDVVGEVGHHVPCASVLLGTPRQVTDPGFKGCGQKLVYLVN